MAEELPEVPAHLSGLSLLQWVHNGSAAGEPDREEIRSGPILLPENGGSQDPYSHLPLRSQSSSDPSPTNSPPPDSIPYAHPNDRFPLTATVDRLIAPRFLTPSKVMLLILTKMYVDGLFLPLHQLEILAFLISHVRRKPIRGPRGRRRRHRRIYAFQPENDIVTGIDQFRFQLQDIPSTVPDRTVWDMFLQKIWELESLDTFHEFFDELGALILPSEEELDEEEMIRRHLAEHLRGDNSDDDSLYDDLPLDPLEDTKLSWESPLGLFVRRAQLEFTRLQARDVIRLWRGYINFRMPTRDDLIDEFPLAEQGLFDNVLDQGDFEQYEDVLYGKLQNRHGVEELASRKDMDSLVKFQSEKIQSGGFRLSHNMKGKMKEMLEAGAGVGPMKHYVSFLDAWKGGHYTAAFESLHRYFDYSRSHQSPVSYQYALLNMAVMQSDFGCYGEAVGAVHEAIAVAREDGDAECLNYCLSWLYHFEKTYKTGSKRNVMGGSGSSRAALTHIRTKAAESGARSLLASAHLAEASVALAEGQSPRRAFEHIARAAWVIHNSFDRLQIAKKLMLEAKVYNRLGSGYMRQSRHKLFLDIYLPRANANDRLLYIGELVVDWVQRGRYNEALTLLRRFNWGSVDVLRLRKAWKTLVSMVRLVFLLRRGNLQGSWSLYRRMDGSAEKVQEDSTPMAYYGIELLSRSGAYTEALRKISSMLPGAELLLRDKPDSKSSPEQRSSVYDLHNMLMLAVSKARVFASAGEPLKGFAIAVRTAAAARRHGCFDVSLAALVQVVTLLIALPDRPRVLTKAAKVLDRVVLAATELEDYSLLARACALQAEVLLARTELLLKNVEKGTGADTNSLDSSPPIQRLRQKAMLYLDRARQAWNRIGDVEGEKKCIAQLALLAAALGQREAAAQLGREYAALSDDRNSDALHEQQMDRYDPDIEKFYREQVERQRRRRWTLPQAARKQTYPADASYSSPPQQQQKQGEPEAGRRASDAKRQKIGLPTREEVEEVGPHVLPAPPEDAPTGGVVLNVYDWNEMKIEHLELLKKKLHPAVYKRAMKFYVEERDRIVEGLRNKADT